MSEGYQEEKNEAFDIDFIADYTINYQDREPEQEAAPPARREKEKCQGSRHGLVRLAAVHRVGRCRGLFVFCVCRKGRRYQGPLP